MNATPRPALEVEAYVIVDEPTNGMGVKEFRLEVGSRTNRLSSSRAYHRPPSGQSRAFWLLTF